jgi:hypothetical protein
VAGRTAACGMLLLLDIIAAGLLCSLCSAALISAPSHAAGQHRAVTAIPLTTYAGRWWWLTHDSLFGRDNLLVHVPHIIRLPSCLHGDHEVS